MVVFHCHVSFWGMLRANEALQEVIEFVMVSIPTIDKSPFH